MQNCGISVCVAVERVIPDAQGLRYPTDVQTLPVCTGWVCPLQKQVIVAVKTKGS